MFLTTGGVLLRLYKVSICLRNVLEEEAAGSLELHLRDLLLLDGLKTDPQTCCVVSVLIHLSQDYSCHSYSLRLD